MRSFAMRLVLCAAVFLVAISFSYTREEAAGMEKRFFDFKPGTEWVFNARFNGSKRKAVYKVVEQNHDGTYFQYDLYNPPDPGATASTDEIWYLKDGYVVWADYDLEQITPYWRIYKLGSVKGDSWKGPGGKGESVNLGETEVTVPAGRFQDVIHIRATDEDGHAHDFYYAPGVGLIKRESRSPRGTSIEELVSFKPGQ
jgi:hypothetical protein